MVGPEFPNLDHLTRLNKWDMENLQMHLWRHMIMTSQCRSKNVTKIVNNYYFEWLSTPIAFVAFDVEPWYYYWRKYIYIKRYCMIFFFLINIFIFINYTEIMTHILQYLSYFSVLLVIKHWVFFNNNTCFHNSLFFNLENFQHITKEKKLWRHTDDVIC